MKRIIEPELMNDREQAQAYARADFTQPHQRFIELFKQTFPHWPGKGSVLDLGCGPGDIAMRFARAFPECQIDGIDGAPAMLEVGYEALKRDSELQSRVKLHLVHLPDQHPPLSRYNAVISNSLLHHLHHPDILWTSVRNYAAPGCPVFIIDLMRPESRNEAERLTSLYVANEADMLRHDFFRSLLASFTVDEVRDQLNFAGLSGLSISAISDRHLMVHGMAPSP